MPAVPTCTYKGKDSTFTLKKLQWHVPHVIVNDDIKLQIYKHMHKDIYIPFRQWELHELPSLKENSSEKWAIRTSSELKKPRSAIVGLQTEKIKQKRMHHILTRQKLETFNFT